VQITIVFFKPPKIIVVINKVSGAVFIVLLRNIQKVILLKGIIYHTALCIFKALPTHEKMENFPLLFKPSLISTSSDSLTIQNFSELIL
jgi:hypothetical protein